MQNHLQRTVNSLGETTVWAILSGIQNTLLFRPFPWRLQSNQWCNLYWWMIERGHHSAARKLQTFYHQQFVSHSNTIQVQFSEIDPCLFLDFLLETLETNQDFLTLYINADWVCLREAGLHLQCTTTRTKTYECTHEEALVLLVAATCDEKTLTFYGLEKEE